MKVSIISEETVRPSKLQTTEPSKLSLMDQLTPTNYTPTILFYQNNNHTHFKNIANQLKRSLSETLSIYYPLAGRVRDNFDIRDFHEGVPFIETSVKCKLLDFLHDQGLHNDRVELLNNLLPMCAERMLPDSVPQVAVQLNVFECGGIGLGMCFSHKTLDGASMSLFLKTWSEINYANISRHDSMMPDFTEGVLTFPPVKSVPSQYAHVIEGIWFASKGNPVKRRFVFNADSISKLKSKARSETLEHPTTAGALSAFIWKATISAYASYGKKNYFEPSLLCYTVNLRKPTRSCLSRNSFGNMVLFTASKYEPEIDGYPKNENLAILLRNGVSKINNEYVSKMYGRYGSQVAFDNLVKSYEAYDGRTNALEISCWYEFGFSKIDFGWGPTVWVGLSGPGAAEKEDDGVMYLTDTVVLIENNKGGIEAWFTLEEPGVMKALESDPDFLEFASTKSEIVP
ncbi:Stemmadenine O-acetyltransferase [Linum grandiflorum]